MGRMRRYWVGDASRAQQDDADVAEATSAAAAADDAPEPLPLRLPAASVLFSAEVEGWVQDQCTSLGCPGVGLSFALDEEQNASESGGGGSSNSIRACLEYLRCTDEPPAKRVCREEGSDDARCHLCRVACEPCLVTGLSHDPRFSGTERVVVDGAVCAHLTALHGTLGQTVAQFGGEVGRLQEETGVLGRRCGVVHPGEEADGHGRCTYTVGLSRVSASEDVPSAFLSVSAGPRSAVTVGLSGCGAGAAGALARAAVGVALSKVLCFACARPDNETEDDWTLVAAAVRMRFPDTALFRRAVPGGVVYCACGLGARHAVLKLAEAEVFTLPSVSLYMSVPGIVRRWSVGIATTVGGRLRAEARTAYLWEIEGASSWCCLPPCDCHLLEASLTGKVASVAHLFAYGGGTLLRVCSQGKTVTVITTGETRRIRPCSPAVRVEDVRVGDLVRLESGDVDMGDGDDGSNRSCTGSLVAYSDGACDVRFDGDDGHVVRCEPRLLRRCVSAAAAAADGAAASQRACVFGVSTESVALARAEVLAQCGLVRDTLFLPPWSKRIVEGKEQDIRMCTGVFSLSVGDGFITATGSNSELRRLRTVTSALSWRHGLAVQDERLSAIRADVTRRMLERCVRAQLPEGFAAAAAAAARVPKARPPRAPEGLRRRIADLRQGKEERYQQEAMVMYSSLDVFSDSVKRAVRGAIPTADWELCYTQLGLWPGAQVTLAKEVLKLQAGELVTLTAAAQAGRFRRSSVGDAVGRVTGVEASGAVLRVDFPSHTNMRVAAADVESRAGPRVYTLLELEIEQGTHFGRAVGKWLTQAAEGVCNAGRLSNAVVHLTRGRVSAKLCCPLTAAISAWERPDPKQGTVEERLARCAERLVQLQWFNACDAFLAPQLLDVSSDLDSAERARAVFKDMLADASAACAALAAALEAVRRDAAAWEEELAASAGGGVKELLVVFTDTDGDVSEVSLADRKIYYASAGKLEQSQVRQSEWDPVQRRLQLLVGDAPWKTVLLPSEPASTIAALMRLHTSSDVPHTFKVTTDAAVAAAVTQLRQRLETVRQEWTNAVTEALVDTGSRVSDLRAERLDRGTGHRKAPNAVLRAVREESGVELDVERGAFVGGAEAVSQASALLRREVPRVAAPLLAAATADIGAPAHRALGANLRFLASLVAEASGAQAVRLHENGKQVTLEGSRDAVAAALEVLGLPADEGGGGADGGVVLSPRGSSGGPAIDLCCGHTAGRWDVVRNGGLLCPTCASPLRVPEVKQLFAGQKGVNLLELVSEQAELWLRSDPRHRKCVCGTWVAVGAGWYSLCLPCNTSLSESRAPLPLPVAPDAVRCGVCGKAGLHKAAVCCAGCFSSVSCTECGVCATDPSHATSVVAVDATCARAGERCPDGHALEEVTGGKLCGGCQGLFSSGYSCSECGFTSCRACFDDTEAVRMTFLDNSFLEGCGLQRRVENAYGFSPDDNDDEGSSGTSRGICFHLAVSEVAVDHLPAATKARLMPGKLSRHRASAAMRASAGGLPASLLSSLGFSHA